MQIPLRPRPFLSVSLALVALFLWGTMHWVPVLPAASKANDPDTVHILEQVGSGGGTVRALAVSGSRLYVGAAATLVIFDVSTPARPVQLARLPFSDLISAIAVTGTGTVVYVATGQSGIQVVDVSQPTSPKLVTTMSTSGYALQVRIVGNRAYAALRRAGMQILDITNPLHPVSLNITRAFGMVEALDVVGTRAYLATQEVHEGKIIDSLRIGDVTNPISPTLQGAVTLTSPLSEVQVVGSMVYLVSSREGLHIINASNVLSPTIQGRRDGFGTAHTLAIMNNHAYVGTYDQGLHIFDVRSPNSPREVGSFGAEKKWIGNVQVNGNIAYLAAARDGVEVLDVSTPSNVMLMGHAETLADVHSVQVVDDVAYVANNRDLHLIDVSNLANPIRRSHLTLPDSVEDIAVVGERAFVAAGTGGLAVLDVSDPLSPTIQSHFVPITPTLQDDWFVSDSYATSVEIISDVAFLTLGSRLVLLDVSVPPSPTPTARPTETISPTRTPIHTPVVSPTTTLTPTLRPTLTPTRMPTPPITPTHTLTPTLLSMYETSGIARDVEVVANLAYVAHDDALTILDVSNPHKPTLRGSYPLASRGSASRVMDLEVVGTKAYVTEMLESSSRVSILDVSDPANPTRLGDFAPASLAPVTLHVRDTYAAVAAGWSGVAIVDVQDPAQPVLRSVFDTPGHANDTWIEGDVMYVADAYGGLQICRIKEVPVQHAFFPLVRQ